MKNKEDLRQTLIELKTDCRRKQKRGLPFILASVPLWLAILVIHASPLPMPSQ